MIPVVGSLDALLVEPIIAVVLGALLGLVVLGLTRAGTRFVTPHDPGRGFARAMILLLFGVMTAFGSLLLYYAVAPQGFLAFSIALITAYFIALAYEAYRASCSLSCKRVG